MISTFDTAAPGYLEPGGSVRARILTPARFTETLIFFGGAGLSGRR
jgi:hypothetical protein